MKFLVLTRAQGKGWMGIHRGSDFAVSVLRS